MQNELPIVVGTAPITTSSIWKPPWVDGGCALPATATISASTSTLPPRS